MAKINESVINFAVYEDNIDYIGMASATLPSLTALTQQIAGAGIAGNIEAVIVGHYDAMTLGLDFKNTSRRATRLSAPLRRTIDLRVAQQVEDTVTGKLTTESVKHVFVTIGKSDSGGSIAPATPTDKTIELAVRYWATYVDGNKILEIDPLNNICFINGVDYLADVRKALGK